MLDRNAILDFLRKQVNKKNASEEELKQALSSLDEETKSELQEKLLTRIFSLDFFSPGLDICVIPSEQESAFVTFVKSNGHYKEIKSLWKFLAERLEEDVNLLFQEFFNSSPNKESIQEIAYKVKFRTNIKRYANEMKSFAPEKKSINWTKFLARNQSIVFLSDGSALLLDPTEDKIKRYKKHRFMNTFAIPSEINFEGYPEKTLRILRNVLGSNTAVDTLIYAFALSLDQANREKMVPILAGPPDSGKSTVLDLAQIVFGEESTDTINTAQLNSSSFHLARFANKLIVFAHESSESAVDDAILKILAGRNKFLADRKFKEAETVESTARFWLATNNIPHLKDPSLGSYIRVWLFKFRRPERKLPAHAIMKIFQEEAPALRGLVISYLLNYLQNGLPEKVKSYLRKGQVELYLEQNPVARFWAGIVEELLEGLKEDKDRKELTIVYDEDIKTGLGRTLTFYKTRDGNWKVKLNSAYAYYRYWANENGHTQISQATFSRYSCHIGPPVPFELEKKKAIFPGSNSEHALILFIDSNNIDVIDVEDLERQPRNAWDSREIDNIDVIDAGSEGQKNSEENTSHKNNVNNVNNVNKKSETFDNQGIPETENIDVFKKETSINVNKKETSPSLSSRVASSFPSEQEPSSEEEGTIEEVLSLEQEPYAEAEEQEEEQSAEEEKQGKKTTSKVRTPEELLAKYQDKIEQVVVILAEAAEAQRKNKKKTKEEELMFLKEFSAKRKGEPRCYNCDYAVPRNKKWFCTLHKIEVFGLDLCDGWEPYQLKRPSQQAKKEEKQTTQKQREEQQMKGKQQATKPAKATTKVKQTKQKQAKERRESLQEKVNRIAQSAAFYEEIIKQGHELLLEIAFRRAA